MKKNLLIVLLLVLGNTSWAQFKFILAAAATGSEDVQFYAKNDQNIYYKCSNSVSAGTIYFGMKYNFKDIGAHSLGVGMPLYFGGQAEANSNSYYGPTKTSLWVFTIPVTLDFNGGYYGNKGHSVRYGYFAGAGLAYNRAWGTESTNFNFELATEVPPQGTKIYEFRDVPPLSSAGFYVHAGAAYHIPNFFRPERSGLTLGLTAGTTLAFTGRNYTNFGIILYDNIGKDTSSKKDSKGKSKSKKKKKKKKKKGKKKKKRPSSKKKKRK